MYLHVFACIYSAPRGGRDRKRGARRRTRRARDSCERTWAAAAEGSRATGEHVRGEPRGNRHTLCARNVRSIRARRAAYSRQRRWRKEQRRPLTDLRTSRRISTRLVSSRLVSSRLVLSCLVPSHPRLPASPSVRPSVRCSALPIVVRVACARPSPDASGRVRCAFLPSGWLRPRDVIHSSAYYAIQDTAVARFFSLLPPPSRLASRSRALSHPLNAGEPLQLPTNPPDISATRSGAPSFFLCVLIARRRRRVLARFSREDRSEREKVTRSVSRGTLPPRARARFCIFGPQGRRRRSNPLVLSARPTTVRFARVAPNDAYALSPTPSGI